MKTGDKPSEVNGVPISPSDYVIDFLRTVADKGGFALNFSAVTGGSQAVTPASQWTAAVRDVQCIPTWGTNPGLADQCLCSSPSRPVSGQTVSPSWGAASSG